MFRNMCRKHMDNTIITHYSSYVRRQLRWNIIYIFFIAFPKLKLRDISSRGWWISNGRTAYITVYHVSGKDVCRYSSEVGRSRESRDAKLAKLNSRRSNRSARTSSRLIISRLPSATTYAPVRGGGGGCKCFWIRLCLA